MTSPVLARRGNQCCERKGHVSSARSNRAHVVMAGLRERQLFLLVLGLAGKPGDFLAKAVAQDEATCVLKSNMHTGTGLLRLVPLSLFY